MLTPATFVGLATIRKCSRILRSFRLLKTPSCSRWSMSWASWSSASSSPYSSTGKRRALVFPCGILFARRHFGGGCWHRLVLDSEPTSRHSQSAPVGAWAERSVLARESEARLFVVAMIQVWKMTGYYMILFLADCRTYPTQSKRQPSLMVPTGDSVSSR